MGMLDIFKRKPKKLQKRGYDGTNMGRLFSDFVTSQKSADSEIRFNLRTLRDRCRELARNNEYAKRYIHLMKTNVVGERGATLQVKATNVDGSLDQIGNAIIEQEWRRWGRTGNCTVDGRFSFADAQAMVIESLARDGECLVRMVNYEGNRERFALEFLEPDLIYEEKNEKLKNGHQIRMGVEMDRYRRPVAYHLLTDHPGDLEYSTYARRTQRVPAEQVLHLYLPERAQQTRGTPWMSTAISALKMLHGYREAELVAARTAAAKMGFFTSRAGDGFQADDIENNVPIMEAEPGSFHQLPQGVEFQQFDPQHPTSAFSDFEKSILRGIASGLGVSYHSLANDLTQTSYSSIRQGALEDRDFFRYVQQYMVNHFLIPVFRQWLSQAMTVGVVNLPISKFDKFAEAAMFRPRGFQWVDPQKEITAHVVALNNGLISMQDVANNYGRDIEELFAQIARDKKAAEQYGLQLAFEPFGGGQSGYGPMKVNLQTGEPFVDMAPEEPDDGN
jgi:lambda family phage portal protein